MASSQLSNMGSLPTPITEVRGDSGHMVHVRDDAERNAFMLGQKKGETTIREQYRKLYLTKNRLRMLFEAFRDLDNILNLFFFSYSKLERSSALCASLWLGVMYVRTIMTNSITHLVDSPHLLSFDYNKIRKEQLKMVRAAKANVAKAVQFLVIYKKNSEYWRFSRRAFLKIRTENMHEALDKTYKDWIELEMRICSMDDIKREAFTGHLEREKKRIKRSLMEVQPKSDIGKNDDQYVTVLDAMISDLRRRMTDIPDGNLLRAYEETPNIFTAKEKRIIGHNFCKIRIQMNIVKDIDDLCHFQVDEGVEYEGQCQSLHEAKEFLEDQLRRCSKAKIMTDDDKIWPHQMGLEDLGPFGLVSLQDPLQYVSVDMEKREYRVTATTIDAIDPFCGIPGKFSAPAPIPYTTRTGSGPKTRKALKIPTKATHFAFFYPIEVDMQKYRRDGFGEKMNTAIAKSDDESPLHVICYYGGFGYFDATGHLLKINGVVLGDDLFFDGPYFLPKADGFKKIELNGHEMVRVTLPFILDAQAERFGWVNDFNDLREAFAYEGYDFGKTGQTNDGFKGAFFYQYDNSQHPEWDNDDNYLEGGRRNYFQVLDFNELSLKKSKNSNTPLLKRLEFEVAQRKDEWDTGYGITTKSEIGDNFSIIERNKKAKSRMGCNVQ